MRQTGATEVSDAVRDSGGRARWTPRLAHPADRATATGQRRDVYTELVAVAERGLDDQTTAERIVESVVDGQPALLEMAESSPDDIEREAAFAQLASLVRRAALDALPPVITVAPATRADAGLPAARRSARQAAARPQGDAGMAAARGPLRGRSSRGAVAALGLLIVVAGVALLLVYPPWTTESDMAAVSDMAGEAEPALTALAAPEVASRPLATGPMADGDPAVRPLVALEPAAGEPTGGGVAAALPPVPARTRVFVHYGEEGPSAVLADELSTGLSRDGGYPVVIQRQVDYTIAAPRVRFFHPQDAVAAERLVGFLGATSERAGNWQIQDFTSFRPQPAPGTLELYIPTD